MLADMALLVYFPKWSMRPRKSQACNLECKHCVKAEKKESNIDIRLAQIDANKDWSEAQKGDPILGKI